MLRSGLPLIVRPSVHSASCPVGLMNIQELLNIREHRESMSRAREQITLKGLG